MCQHVIDGRELVENKTRTQIPISVLVYVPFLILAFALISTLYTIIMIMRDGNNLLSAVDHDY